MSVLLLLSVLVSTGHLHGALDPAANLAQPDWPMYGGGPTRNAIRPGADAPVQWRVRQVGDEWHPGLNIKPESHRDPAQREPAPVLMCFREADGAFVWQYGNGVKHQHSTILARGEDADASHCIRNDLGPGRAVI